MNAMRLLLLTAALLIGLTASITKAQPTSNPTAQSSPATPPPPAAVYPPGAMPPGVPQPGALPPGTMPPNGFPPGAMPAGAFPPGLPPPGFVPPPQPQPSENSTRLRSYEQMFAEGQYAALIEKVNARLAEAKRKKQKISVGEHFAILRHKGESHLRLKSQHQAIAAFKDAAALEVADMYRAEPAAMVLLLQRSKQFAYSPRSGASKGQPIDVLADRKRALDALLVDELEAVRPKVAGKTPTALPQVLQMLEQTQNLRTIEMATTGGQAPQSVELLQPIGMQARFLMTDALNAIRQDVQAINVSANRTTIVTDRLSRHEYKAGLSDGDKVALRNHFDMALRIGRAATELSGAFPTEAGGFQEIAKNSLEVRDAANAVANGNYKQRSYGRE